jgi:hypothetical protein
MSDDGVRLITGVMASKNGITLFLQGGESEILRNEDYRTAGIIEAVMLRLTKEPSVAVPIELKTYSLAQKLKMATGGQVQIKNDQVIVKQVIEDKVVETKVPLKSLEQVVERVANGRGAAGFMTGADKTTLDGSAAGAQVNVGTNLTYNASTRALASSTGTGATVPLFTSTDPGLAPLSGGGTTNFLRADGTWAPTPGGGGSSLTVQDEGSTLSTAVTTINFTGAGVTASGAATVTVNVPGGGSGSFDYGIHMALGGLNPY